MAVRLQLKLGAVTEQDQLADSPDAIVVVEPSVGSVARSKGNLYLLVTSRITGNRAREATRMIADTIRNEYYYDESAGIRQCLTKVMGVANKRLAHQRDRYGMGHPGADGGPIGVAVAVVRGRELYVATVGPAEAYLIRQARLSTLPDPNRDRGLPVDELEPEVWRGELSVGDSLCLVSANIVAKIGTDALKDALVTLHPQSAIEHLHARFVAADGKGSDGALAFEANEVGATHKAKIARPGAARRAARRRSRQVAHPARGHRDRQRRRDRRRRDQGAQRAPATGSSARSGASRTCSPVARPAPARSPGPRRAWRRSAARPSPCSRSSPSPERSCSACTSPRASASSRARSRR